MGTPFSSPPFSGDETVIPHAVTTPFSRKRFFAKERGCRVAACNFSTISAPPPFLFYLTMRTLLSLLTTLPFAQKESLSARGPSPFFLVAAGLPRVRIRGYVFSLSGFREFFLDSSLCRLRFCGTPAPSRRRDFPPSSTEAPTRRNISLSPLLFDLDPSARV